MQVGFNLTNLFRYARVNPTDRDAFAAATIGPQLPRDISQATLNDRRVARLEGTLGELDDLLTRGQLRTRLGRATAVSTRNIGLSNGGTAARLDSVEQVNTQLTSYTPFGPVFTGSGSSTALAEISGVYDGSNGTDTLRFQVSRGGVHGESRIDVKVLDSAGDRLETIRIQPWHDPDRNYSVGNGLVFQLGPGELIKNDEFHLDVSTTLPSAVDPDKPFDGTRNDRPNFDPGLTVTAGSFEINGVEIAVNGDDTINTVLARIDASEAGVSASFDSASETVRLTQHETGSAYDIVIENDTSGFVAAAKLTGSAVAGLDTEAFTPMALTSALSGVSAGTLRINGGSVAFDPATDSLADVVARIDAADVGVSARLINDNQRLLLRHTHEGAPLDIDDGGTQFFDATLVVEKTYRARARTGFSRAHTYAIADRVEDTTALLNEVFNPAANPGNDARTLDALRDGIVAALRTNAPDGTTAFGLRFALDAPVRARFVTVDRGELTRGQRRNAGGAQGFLQGLSVSLRGALEAYRMQYGLQDSGLLLNTVA